MYSHKHYFTVILYNLFYHVDRTNWFQQYIYKNQKLVFTKKKKMSIVLIWDLLV